MDVKEKLVELLGANTCKHDCCEDCEHCETEDDCTAYLKDSMADHLIASGVTVQEWISVDDRLPEENKDVLMLFGNRNGINMAVGFLREKDENITFWSAYPDGGWVTDCDESPLYWMPLPQPPKGE